MTLGTSPEPEGLTKPPLHELLNHADSKYSLLMFGAKRAKQINDYFLQFQEGLLNSVGPLVSYVNNEQPLSIAFREINEGIVKGKLGSETPTSLSPSKVISDSIPLSAKDLSGFEEEEEDDEEDMDGEDEERGDIDE